MTTQRLSLDGGYPDGVWVCPGCTARLTDGVLEHDGDCSEVCPAAAVAEAVAAERDRIAAAVSDLRGRSLRLAELTGDGYLAAGYHAQVEVLASVLALLGGDL